jgi:hypothetical membrane protein
MTPQRIFRFMFFAAAQFVALTLVAMLLYPGSTIVDDNAANYQFTRNFFSDLGITVTYAGEPNWASAALFFVALSVAGISVILFFALMPRFFRHTRLGYGLAWLGSAFGFITGASFVGVAWTPANLLPGPHTNFVYAAFTSFLVVVICYIGAIVRHGSYPKRYAGAYAVFALVLAGYLWLLFAGPSIATPTGIAIQATGQKVVVYAAIICMGVQALGALRQSERIGDA